MGLHGHAHGGGHHHGHGHDHSHDAGHGPTHGHEQPSRPGHAHRHDHGLPGARVLLVAVALTAGYGVVELVGGLFAHSLALIADAGHMATDAAALLFALGASLIARRPASDRHSFGLARIEVIAAFVNALAMLAIVSWLLYEALRRILDPVAVNGGSVFVIAAIGLGVNLVVAYVLSRGGSNLNTRAALVHVMGDLLGSVAAIVAGVVIYFTGFTPIDPLLSALVAGLILRSTLSILRETTRVLLDSVPDGVEYPRVGAALARVPGVVSVHDLHVWAMVPGRSALSAHVLVDDIRRWPAILSTARTTLRREFGIVHVTLQPEWLRRDLPQNAIPIRPAR